MMLILENVLRPIWNKIAPFYGMKHYKHFNVLKNLGCPRFFFLQTPKNPETQPYVASKIQTKQ